MSIREKIVRDFKFAICESKAKKRTLNFQNMNLDNSIKIVASTNKNQNSLYNNTYLSHYHLVNSMEKINPNDNHHPTDNFNSLNLRSKSSRVKKQVFQHLKLKSFEEPNVPSRHDSDILINNYHNSSLKRKNFDSSNSRNVFL